MRLWTGLVAGLLVAVGVPVRAQAPAAGAAVPAASRVTMEYYYRIKWGSAGEFKQLYNKNHAPLLAAMQQAGFIRSIRVDEPFTHLAGGPRWDLRVTVVYRDAAAAINDPRWDALWAEAKARLYKDKAAFDAEEDRRFAMLEDHWDVVVNEVKD